MAHKVVSNLSCLSSLKLRKHQVQLSLNSCRLNNWIRTIFTLMRRKSWGLKWKKVQLSFISWTRFCWTSSKKIYKRWKHSSWLTWIADLHLRKKSNWIRSNVNTKFSNKPLIWTVVSLVNCWLSNNVHNFLIPQSTNRHNKAVLWVHYLQLMIEVEWLLSWIITGVQSIGVILRNQISY